MRVMAGALEGDLFIGPKAEVTSVVPVCAWVEVFCPRSLDWWSEGPGPSLGPSTGCHKHCGPFAL